MGAVSECCCKEVYIIDILIIIITCPTPLVLGLFLQHHPYFFVHLKNVFSFLYHRVGRL